MAFMWIHTIHTGDTGLPLHIIILLQCGRNQLQMPCKCACSFLLSLWENQDTFLGLNVLYFLEQSDAVLLTLLSLLTCFYFMRICLFLQIMIHAQKFHVLNFIVCLNYLKNRCSRKIHNIISEWIVKVYHLRRNHKNQVIFYIFCCVGGLLTMYKESRPSYVEVPKNE